MSERTYETIFGVTTASQKHADFVLMKFCLGCIRYMPLRWRRINTSAKLLQNTLSDHAERVQLLQGMVSNLVTESAKSKDRLDITMEHVSVLLSRIREHPVPSSRYARNDCFT